MRSVIFGSTGWAEAFPVRQRGDVTRMIFSLAAQHGYTILMHGQHWSNPHIPMQPDTKQARQYMTPERWASLMGAHARQEQ